MIPPAIAPGASDISPPTIVPHTAGAHVPTVMAAH